MKKQETLEEAAHEHFKKGQLGFEKAADTEHAFIKGAKWQQQQMYSEEEVKLMLYNCCESLEEDNRRFSMRIDCS